MEQFARVATRTAQLITLLPLQRLALTAICVLILGGILMAGLWPFQAPRNDVAWLEGEGGLQFGQHGSIVSSNSFRVSAADAESPCSFEIWLQPLHANYSGTILAFYQPATSSRNWIAPFRIRQSLADLTIDRADFEASGRERSSRIYVDDLFGTPKPVFLAITSGDAGTTVYADGSLVRKYDQFHFSSKNLTGQFLVGNTPTTSDSWRGQVKGIAIYRRELTAAEVANDYANWNQPSGHEIRDGLVARYRFDEGRGSVVRNQVDSATDLVIPERFFVLRAWFLEPFWKEFHRSRSYWEDVAVNIGGFVPLGFVFCAYLTLAWRMERATAITVALGFLVSLTIEVSQSFLPSRNSGTTDLFTNTLGTWLGVVAYRQRLVQTVMARVIRPLS